MPILELQNLAKSYGNTPVLNDVNLSVEAGDFAVIYGTPSSGKSVLVRLLTGLEQADAGSIHLRGQDITMLSPGERNIGYVPQSFALYPHMNVYKNIAYPLTLAGAKRTEIQPAVERTAELLGIAELLDRKPDQLSGGQKQRVAIARGLVKQTEVFVLDDPLVGLDFKLRERLIDDLRETQETLGVTFIYTTSDAVETMMLANYIAVLHEGEIVETGEPFDLYDEPAHPATMEYIGFPQANMLYGSLHIDDLGQMMAAIDLLGTNVDIGTITEMDAHQYPHVKVGIRPEHIYLIAEPPTDIDDIITGQAKVLLREDLGGEEIVYLALSDSPDDETLTSVVRSDDISLTDIELGRTVDFWIQTSDMKFYPYT